MILNRGGALSKEYFAAYMTLVMNTRECSVSEAKEVAFQRLFKNNADTLGRESYDKFLLAYEGMDK